MASSDLNENRHSSLAWAASKRIYDPTNSGAKVAETIGGFVERNINNPDPKQKWSNTCAVRMSYILNQAGLLIPRKPGKTVSGADGRHYFFRVKDLIDFLKNCWGPADIVKYPPSGGGALAGKKGLFYLRFPAGQMRKVMQASTRTHAQNYKDMVLASCITSAYTNEKNAAIDAGSSVCALRDWTYYDPEKSPDAIQSLVNSYLARNHQNPLAESEIRGVRFDLLKCLDLYHSKQLESLVKRVVIQPKRTYREGDPLPVKTR